MSRKNKLRHLIIAVLGLFLFIGVPKPLIPVNAQTINPEIVAEQVYQQIRELPRENQYLSQETGQVATDNTLISRLVRYHQYVKNRPTNFRFDWQLTLADYLDANETIKEERYPGATTLQTNPLQGDRQIISSLNRRQRSELVDLLVSIYGSQIKEKPTTNQPTTPQPHPSPTTPIIPQPGDAELLK